MNAPEPVYMELVDFVARGATAEQVAGFRPSPEAQKRVSDLLERQRESDLTEEEAAELDGFVQLEHILGLAKAKAQLILASRREDLSGTPRRSGAAGEVPLRVLPAP